MDRSMTQRNRKDPFKKCRSYERAQELYLTYMSMLELSDVERAVLRSQFSDHCSTYGGVNDIAFVLHSSHPVSWSDLIMMHPGSGKLN